MLNLLVRALSYALSPQLVDCPFWTTVSRLEPIFHLFAWSKPQGTRSWQKRILRYKFERINALQTFLRPKLKWLPRLQNLLKQGGIFKSDVFPNSLREKYEKVKFTRKGVKLRPETPVGRLPVLEDCFTSGTYFSFVCME